MIPMIPMTFHEFCLIDAINNTCKTYEDPAPPLRLASLETGEPTDLGVDKSVPAVESSG